jgi:hypothetical protein
LAILLVLLGGWFFSHPGAVQLKDKDLRKKEPYSISWGEALNVGAAQFLPASLPIKEILIPSVEPVNVKLWIPSSGATFTLRPSSVATVLQVAGWILVPIGVAAMTGVLMRKKQ